VNLPKDDAHGLDAALTCICSSGREVAHRNCPTHGRSAASNNPKEERCTQTSASARPVGSSAAAPGSDAAIRCDVAGCTNEAQQGCGITFQNRCAAHSAASRSVEENIAPAFRATWRLWQWRVCRIRKGWEWGWLGQGWNVLRLGKVRVWL
jgi:hypothetical protein